MGRLVVEAGSPRCRFKLHKSAVCLVLDKAMIKYEMLGNIAHNPVRSNLCRQSFFAAFSNRRRALLLCIYLFTAGAAANGAKLHLPRHNNSRRCKIPRI